MGYSTEASLAVARVVKFNQLPKPVRAFVRTKEKYQLKRTGRPTTCYDVREFLWEYVQGECEQDADSGSDTEAESKGPTLIDMTPHKDDDSTRFDRETFRIGIGMKQVLKTEFCGHSACAYQIDSIDQGNLLSRLPVHRTQIDEFLSTRLAMSTSECEDCPLHFILTHGGG